MKSCRACFKKMSGKYDIVGTLKTLIPKKCGFCPTEGHALFDVEPKARK